MAGLAEGTEEPTHQEVRVLPGQSRMEAGCWHSGSSPPPRARADSAACSSVQVKKKSVVSVCTSTRGDHHSVEGSVSLVGGFLTVRTEPGR